MAYDESTMGGRAIMLKQLVAGLAREKAERDAAISAAQKATEAKIPTKNSQLENDSKYATETSVNNLENRINDIVATGGEPNTINKIKVNGAEQNIAEDKSVDIAVPTKVSDITNDSKFQTDTEVATAIQAAIAATGHAVFTKVDAVPSASDAAANVLYLVMNATTSHYDIYAKVGEEVVLIDDTTVNLTAYSTTEQMNAAIAAAVEALNIGQYAKVDAVNGLVTRVDGIENRVKALEDFGATKVEASTTQGNIKINGTETPVVVFASTDEFNAALASVYPEA